MSRELTRMVVPNHVPVVRVYLGACWVVDMYATVSQRVLQHGPALLVPGGHAPHIVDEQRHAAHLQQVTRAAHMRGCPQPRAPRIVNREDEESQAIIAGCSNSDSSDGRDGRDGRDGGITYSAAKLKNPKAQDDERRSMGVKDCKSLKEWPRLPRGATNGLPSKGPTSPKASSPTRTRTRWEGQ